MRVAGGGGGGGVERRGFIRPHRRGGEKGVQVNTELSVRQETVRVHLLIKTTLHAVCACLK